MSGPPWKRLDTVLAAALGLTAFVTRAAVRGHALVTYDSGLLASGIVAYDFDEESPHPPFYPLTIATGKALATFVGPVDALVWLSVAASAVMVAATFAVARQLAGRVMAGGAAGLLLLSPTALFNGSVALSYAAEGAASAVVALCALRLHRRPSPSAGVAAGIALSVAAGLRPSAGLFLAPVVLWAAWGQRRPLLATVGAGAAATAAWFVPMLVAGGGLRDFLTYNGYQSRHVILSRTAFEEGLSVMAANVARLASYAPLESAVAAAATAIAAITFLAWRSAARRSTAWFLAWWAAPSAAFYAFVYVGWPVHPSGYAMVLLPPVAVGSALMLAATWRGVRKSDAARPAQVLACALVVSIAASPLAWLGKWPEAMEAQRQADDRDAQWAQVAQAFPPNETAFLTFTQWHWARVEHPEYITWGVRPYWNETGILLVQVTQARGRVVDRPLAADFLDGPFEEPHPIPPGIVRVIVLDEGGEAGLLKDDVALAPVRLPSGRTVLAFDPTRLDSIEEALTWFDAAGRLDVDTLGKEDVRGL